MGCNSSRVKEVASAFSEVETEGIEAFDEEEPEFDTLKTLRKQYDSDDHLALLSVMAGLSDFQLAIDAQAYWNSLEEIALSHGSLDSIQDVNTIMDEFLDEPVNARYTEMKRNRLVKLNDNGFPMWFLDNYPIESPAVIWERTAIDLGGRGKMSDKTVVLAMKILDIHNLIINGSYLPFPDNIDIPVDEHVGRIARYSGITSSTDEEQVRECWAEVADEVEQNLDDRVSLLRIDSVVFQFGQQISGENFDPEDSRQVFYEHAVETGVSPENAKMLANELTVNL